MLSAENGKTILNTNYNVSATGTDGLWKTSNFNLSNQSEVTFIISGSGYSNDKIRIEIDNKDYLWTGENSINGRELLGIPKTVLIKETLISGNHSIKIYKQGNPNLYSVVAYSVNVAFLNLKVFLEGCYNNNSMNSTISQLSDFPMSQPFNSLPWNYLGNEKISSIPPKTIDWVLVELRNLKINPTKRFYKAALLKNDGSIIDVDGSELKIYGADSGNYFVTIYHRNHLSILSSTTVSL